MIAYKINDPTCAFLAEGLACSFEINWWGQPNELWCKYYKKHGKLPKLEILFDEEYFWKEECQLTYPIAGHFVTWFCKAFSIEAFLAVYRKDDKYFEEMCQQVALSSDELNQKFLDAVEQVELTPEQEKILKERLER